MKHGSMWALIRHDMKLRVRARRTLPRAWRIAYGVIAVLFVCVVAFRESASNPLFWQNAWFFTFSFPFVAFGLAAGATGREWRNGTVEWWLTLPVSRVRLVFAKVIALGLQSLLIFAAIYVAVALLGLSTAVTHGQMASVSQFLWTGVEWMGMVWLITPFVGTLGILFAVLRHSQARPALPLIWLAFLAMWWSGVGRGAQWIQTDTNGITVTHVAPIVWGLVGASWLVTLVLVYLISYLLERRLTM